MFEMGTGVSSALKPPATNIEAAKEASSKEKGREEKKQTSDRVLIVSKRVLI